MARTHDLPRLARGATMRADVVAHRSVTAVSAGRLNRGDGVQIEIDHVLKRRRGGAVAQAFRQGFKPRGALGLNRDHLDQRIVPALASIAAPPEAFNGERWLNRLLSGAMATAFGVAQRGGAFRHTAWAWLFSLRNDDQWDPPAALKRSSYRIANWFTPFSYAAFIAGGDAAAESHSLFAASSVGKWPRG
jgi:hypothetical protein